MAEKKQPDIYQVKVKLEGIRPPIWRRILVTSDTTLGKFHRILQVVMGWDDYHLHQFIINGAYYGKPDYGVILASFFLTSKSLMNCLYCSLF